jgi:hypothetical protein
MPAAYDRAEQMALAKMAVDACEAVRLEAAAAAIELRIARPGVLPLHLGEATALANYSGSDSPVPRAKRLQAAIEKSGSNATTPTIDTPTMLVDPGQCV